MEKSLVFNINGTGLNVDLVGIVGSTLRAIVVFAICYALSRKVEMKPNKKQNVLEYLIDFTDGIVKDNVEDPGCAKTSVSLRLCFVPFHLLHESTRVVLGSESR